MIFKERRMAKLLIFSDFSKGLVKINKKSFGEKCEIINLQDYKERKIISDEEFVRKVISRAINDYSFARRIVNGN
jgi:hypothetical protein